MHKFLRSELFHRFLLRVKFHGSFPLCKSFTIFVRVALVLGSLNRHRLTTDIDFAVGVVCLAYKT